MTRPTRGSRTLGWALVALVLGVGLVVLVVIVGRRAASPEIAATSRSGPSERGGEPAAWSRLTTRSGAGATPLGLPVIEGVVRARGAGDGRGGIAGASVCATPAGSLLRIGGEHRIPSIAGFLATVCVRSDAHGRFSLPPSPSLRRGGRLLVDAVAPGYRPGPAGGVAVDVIPGGALDPLALLLDPGGLALRGTVVDRFGGPIEGALVTSGGGGVVLTGDDGAFALTVADARTIVVAWHPGFVTQGLPVVAPRGELVLTMVPESVVEGRVVDPGGQAVAGIEVRTWRDEAEVAWTDEDGGFRLSGLRPGIVQFWATGEAQGGTSRPLQLGVGATLTGVEIRVTPQEIVVWSVVDAVTLDPCAGATVALQSAAAPSLPVFTADPAGSLRLVQVPPGIAHAVVRCPGHVTHEEEVLIAPGERRAIALAPGITVFGTVYDAAGEPVADAQVEVSKGDPAARGRPLRAKSAVDGRFSLDGLPSGSVTLGAHAPRSLGVAPATLEIELQGPRDDLELRLPATGELHGRVVDGRGAPASGAQIVLRGADGAGGGEVPRALRLVSDEEGLFSASPAPGRYWVTATWSARHEPEGEGAAEDAREPVVVPGTGAASLTLRLPPRPAYRLRGRVFDREGAPLADVAVRADGVREALTADDGAFEIAGLVDPTVHVSLDADDGGHAVYRDLDLRGDRSHRLLLGATALVCGEVRGLDPTGSFTVHGLHFPADDPSFCVPGIPEGRQILVAEQGGRSGSAAVEIGTQGQGAPQVTIDLVDWAGPLHGRVVDREGAPVAVSLWLLGPDGRYLATCETGEGGAFACARAPAGVVELVFRRPRQLRGRDTWPRITLELAPGAEVRGIELVVEGR